MTNKHFGYWVFGKDMESINLESFKKNGVTDIFLNFYAFTTYSEKKVLDWIAKANKNNINVHIWMQCFYDGKWHNPKTENLDARLKEAKKYANLKGVKGVHLDYLRYPGNAYQTEGGADAITNFVKKVRSQNPKTFLSCAVMPEQSGKYYYGQDVDALGKIVDAIIPMQYKGNYEANTTWVGTTSKLFASKGTLWSGIQSYKSDNNTAKLSSSELIKDVKTCLNNGAKGVILFRYGLSTDINFAQFQPSTKTSTKEVSAANIKTIADKVKTYVEEHKKLPGSVIIDNKKYNYGQVAYILSYAVNNIGESIKVPTIKNAEKSSGNIVDENLAENDYKDIAKRVYSYIKTNKQCPNYVSTKKSQKKLRPRVFIYAFARIIVWYYNHNKALPKYVNVNSEYFKATSKKATTTEKANNGLNAYMTTQGCSGMGQCTGYNCACNSLQQCFYRLTGIKVAESTIASVAGTTSAGTGHAGIETTVSWFNKKYNQNIKITWKNFSDLGSSASARWLKMQEYINTGAVFNHIMYRNQWGHYEVPKQISGDNVICLNSLGNSCGGETYCGYIETRSKSEHLSYINGISQKSIAILTKG